jgi:transposase
VTITLARQRRRTHSATFNAHGAVAALRGEKNVGGLAEKFVVHPNQIATWKAQFLDRSREDLDEKADVTPAPNIDKMEVKTGSLTLENECFESALSSASIFIYQLLH